MRIALLPSAYAPSLGGAEELTRRLAGRLAAGGDQVEVWTIRHPGTLPADEVVDGQRVRRFDLPLPRATPAALARLPGPATQALAALWRAAAEFRPDLLHVQCFSANGLYAVALAACRRLPLVVSLQGETFMDDHDIYQRSTALRAGLRLALRRADAVTACSRFTLDDAVGRFGLRPGTGLVVPNGVETAGDGGPPRPLPLPFDRFVLGLGRIVAKKGFDLLVDAFARLAPRRPGLGLVLAGDGPARAGLTAQAARLGIADRVHLPGRLGRAEVAWAMGAADVFVLPSRVEPFGIVVLEALRAGRPVVASARGGAKEIVRHERDALLADPLDVAQLAGAISRLLDDRDLARRLAAAGRERVGRFDWSAVADGYRRVYRSVA
ncbi:MAG TPA: glycosyltransferase family 4 protein [Actinomycetota bacterium]